jgi:hypothetical protein
MKKVIAGFLVLAIAVAFVLSNYEVGVSQNANGYFLSAKVRTVLNVQGRLSGTTKIFGVKTFGSTQLGTNPPTNPDTLIIPGGYIDSTSTVILQPIFQLAADTSMPQLFPKYNAFASGGVSDTVYVYQTTKTILRKIKYGYFVGRVGT